MKKKLPQQDFEYWKEKVFAISKFSGPEKDVLIKIVKEIGANIVH